MSSILHERQAVLWIKAPMWQVAECLVRWGSESAVRRRTRSRFLPSATLDTGWKHLTPRAFIPHRAFLARAGGWTAFFDNHEREFLPAAELYVLCERLHADTCFFGVSGDETSGQFCYYSSKPGGVAERAVISYVEDERVLSMQGEPLACEDLDAYARAKDAATNPLSRRVLESYARQLILPIRLEEFLPGITLLEWRNDNTGTIRSRAAQAIRWLDRRCRAATAPR